MKKSFLKSNAISNFIELSFLKVSLKRKLSLYISIIAVIALFYIRLVMAYDEFSTIIQRIIDLLLFYFCISLLLSTGKAILITIYRKRNKLSVGRHDNTIIGIDNLYWLLLSIIMFFGTLYYSGVEIVNFFATFALVSVAFAWIFKDYIANIIDGLIIIFSEDFKIGDYIHIDNVKGRIKDIRFLNIKLITDEGDVVFFPNTLLMQKEVVNFSKVKAKKIIYDFEIDKSLFTKVRKVERVIVKNLIKEFEGHIESENFAIQVNTINHQGASLSAEIPVKNYDFKVEHQIKKNISLSVMEFIDKEEDKEE
ncbi:MAG: mechanosensitive ion channel family protein [Candidatus Nanoarchaeia archaeon]